MVSVEWNYSDRAAHYDKRPDYSDQAIDDVLKCMGLQAPCDVGDIGAGTAKLSRPLALRGCNVSAVEPNREMRMIGMRNTATLPVTWSDGTGEKTGLSSASVQAAFFGSSFNVVDQAATLRECGRILVPGGWFCCMWNHRDLSDPLQARIEEAIKAKIPGYNYGKRREDPTEIINSSGLYDKVQHINNKFTAQMSMADVIEAWKSHATLARQAGSAFEALLKEIEVMLDGSDLVKVPYSSRIWFAQLAS